MSTATHHHSISVGQLRQNPTEMLQAVQDGETFVITNHGRPIADVVPHARTAWVKVERVADLLREPINPEWSRELEEGRAETDLRDPWS